jgi:hypothetical protein
MSRGSSGDEERRRAGGGTGCPLALVIRDNGDVVEIDTNNDVEEREGRVIVWD